jgi:ferredoxin
MAMSRSNSAVDPQCLCFDFTSRWLRSLGARRFEVEDLASVRNEQTHRKDLTTFTYDLSRCMFCGLCEDACPVDALELTQDFELASYTRRWNLGPTDARGGTSTDAVQVRST